MWQSIQQHPTMWALGAWYVFSAAISALPMPKADAPQIYSWAFAFLHTVAGSIGRVMAMKYSESGLVDAQVKTTNIQPAGDGVKIVEKTTTTQEKP